VQFLYNVRTTEGRFIKGEIEATDESQAVQILREKKYLILNLRSLKVSPFKNMFQKGVSSKDKLIFVKELSVMLQSSLPLVDALESLKEQTSNPELIQIVGELSIDIRGGKSFSESLKKFPKTFSKMFINIIAAGEKSGKLDKTLERLSIQIEKDYEIQSKVKSALMYPVIVLIALAGVLILAFVYIIPQLRTVFDDMGVELPIITRIVLGISYFITHYWWLIIIIIAGLYFLIINLIKTDSYRLFWDRFKLKIPIYGPYINKIYMARFSRNLETMVSSGLPITESLRITKDVMTNSVYGTAIDEICQDVENGVELSISLKKKKSFPPMVSQLIGIGEKSGKLDFVLASLANFYDQEVEATTRNLTAILEPVLTIIMAVGVALVAASVVMPIYGLVNAI